MCKYNETKYRECLAHAGCEEDGIPCKNLTFFGAASSAVCKPCTSLTCHYEPEDMSLFLGMNI